MADSKRIIKVQLSDSEHHLVRIAAAIEDKTMGAFCRDLIVEHAAELTAGLDSKIKKKKASSRKK